MTQFNTLQEWLGWLEANHPVAKIELGLSRILQVAQNMELLEFKTPVISVAGTNGKGSVVATLEALAIAHNLSIASYTSPHLIKFNERIKFNAQAVNDQLLLEAFAKVSANQENIELTYFEFTTLVALYCFSQQDLDLIVLEVGLGGRFDAINIIDADISIITSIGLDHTDWLGSELSQIAYEKAGIMRKGQLSVIADKSLVPLLKKAIDEIRPDILVADEDFQYLEHASSWDYVYDDLVIKNIHKSQLYLSNQVVALTAFTKLFKEKITKHKLKAALENTQLLGRFQMLSQSPYIILDVAHNSDSARLLNQRISDLVQSSKAKVWALCGMLKDKDIYASLSEMDSVDQWLLIDLPGERGALAEDLHYQLNTLMDAGKIKANSIISSKTIEKAYDCFKTKAEPEDLLMVFGSFVTVGLMLEYWQ